MNFSPMFWPTTYLNISQAALANLSQVLDDTQWTVAAASVYEWSYLQTSMITVALLTMLLGMSRRRDSSMMS